MVHEHGSPYDRGNSDAYYGRGKNPHKWVGEEFYIGTMKCIAAPCTEVPLTDPTEIEEYNRGYDECTDRKEWF